VEIDLSQSVSAAMQPLEGHQLECLGKLTEKELDALLVDDSAAYLLLPAYTWEMIYDMQKYRDQFELLPNVAVRNGLVGRLAGKPVYTDLFATVRLLKGEVWVMRKK